MSQSELLSIPERVGLVAAHPDDTEVMISTAAFASKLPYAFVLTHGERSTLNYTRSSLC